VLGLVLVIVIVAYADLVGLALRHGWGVARDDKRAFAELRRACNESLAEGGLSLHQSPGAKTVKLSSQEKKAMAVSFLVPDDTFS
jgi:TPR repeat protein